MQSNMYRKRPLEVQNSQPIRMPGGGRSEGRCAEGRPPQGMRIGELFFWALLSHRRGQNIASDPVLQYLQ